MLQFGDSFVCQRFPSLLLLAPSGLPLELKTWRFPNMGYIKISAKEEVKFV
jgi:hypothetical protein